MGTINTLVNEHEKGFYQETLTKMNHELVKKP